jgi:hypothetical protein
MGDLLRGVRQRVRRPLARGEDAATCRASGWRLRVSCTDTNGGMVCPVCRRTVPTRPDSIVRHPVQVIQDHPACA